MLKRLHPAVAAGRLVCGWAGQRRLRRRSKMVSFVTFVTACKRRILNKLPSGLYLMRTPSAAEMLWRKTKVTATRKRLKITGTRTQPCLTPVLTAKFFDISLPCTTRALIPAWNSRKKLKKCGGHPNLRRTRHSKSRLTVSKAFVRSMKAIKRSRCCSLHFSWRSLATKIISVVLRARRKPHWDSGTTVSTTYVRRRINITWASYLPATDRKEMPRLFFTDSSVAFSRVERACAAKCGRDGDQSNSQRHPSLWWSERLGGRPLWQERSLADASAWTGDGSMLFYVCASVGIMCWSQRDQTLSRD